MTDTTVPLPNLFTGFAREGKKTNCIYQREVQRGDEKPFLHVAGVGVEPTTPMRMMRIGAAPLASSINTIPKTKPQDDVLFPQLAAYTTYVMGLSQTEWAR